jgi:diadenylate cyclase
MQLLNSILFIPFRWLDLIDIVLVAILIYQVYNIVKGTAAIRIFVGVLLIYILWKMFELMKMELLSEILGQFIGVGVIALIIVFQPELRRFLILVGTTGVRDWPVAKRLFNWKNLKGDSINKDSIIKACANMCESKTGALIVLTKTSDLFFVLRGGEPLDSKYSSRVIESIFFKNSPLHDGAVIISGNRITAARCVLPVTDNPDFPARLGMRHRSAVGITENTDAIAIIVSEQTGTLSYAKEGQMHNNISLQELEALLDKNFN